MALYRGTIQVSGGGSGNVREFIPENQGSVGQILTKTATGYDWETGSGGPTYTAGANITIDANNEISAIDTTYSAGANITIDSNNEISATDTTYVAGDFDIKDLADSTGLRTSWSGKADASDINTKTFYLASESDLVTAQDIYDWRAAGKEAIVKYNGTDGKEAFVFQKDLNSSLYFSSTNVTQYNNDGVSAIYCKLLRFFYSGSTVTGISYTSQDKGSYLDTNINYSGYTPLYDGSPTTKKYVDDSLSAKISTGTTAPSNPTEGQLWYDSTNDVLKVYDGTQWNSVGGGGGGGSYTAGANIDITNDVISAENVIVTDAINNTGFKIEDANDNFADIGLSNTYEIKIGNEQDDQQGNYDYTDVDIIGNTGTIGGHNYHDTSTTEDHREFYITSEGIEATREITSGGTTTTTTENYYWIDNGLGNTDDKIAKLGDIVTYSAGTNISIDANNEISATDTTYSAGTGLTLNGTTFNVDTTTIATKADIANLSSFEVVATLPSASSASTKTIYLLGPIGTGADKYEEWIVTEQPNSETFTGQPVGSHNFYYTPGQLSFSEATTLTYISSTGGGSGDRGFCLETAPYYGYFEGGVVGPDEGWYEYNGSTWDFVSATSITVASGTYNLDCGPGDYDFDTIVISTGTENTWTKIGETSIDLSGYATTSALTSGLATKQDTLTAGTNVTIDANNEISAIDTTYSAGTNVSIDANNVISATDTTYSASDFDIKDLADSTSLRTTWSGKQDAFFTSGSTAPANPSEGDAWYDTTNDIFKTYDGTNWNVTSDFPGMTILSYGHNTWQDFLSAYNKSAIVYCRASSNSNPATGSQTRMAFMAYVNNAENPTEVEFQYYRSRADHNSAANQLDQVFVYKLTSASGGTWTVTERNTAAKAVAGTGISLAFGGGNMTISASAQYDDTTYGSSWDGVIDKAPTKNAVYDKISAMDTTISGKQDALTAGTNIQIDSNTNTISATDTTYSAGDGISISANNGISADISPSTQTGAASTMKIWLGSQSDYDNLASYDSGTLYFTTSS